MTNHHFVLILVCIAVVVTGAPVGAQGFRQTQTDDYTRYELLTPETQSFRIVYDVSATTAGSQYFFNGIRAGSEPTVHGVYDLMTGAALEWNIVDGTEAKSQGHLNARPDGQYIQVRLPRAVPVGGQVRLRIDKTYRDPESYRAEGGQIVFDRSLGINRNAVVLPAGYELVAANYPVQIALEEDDRVRASFMNRGPAGVPLVIRARPVTTASSEGVRYNPIEAPATISVERPVGARVGYRFSERAFQDRDIVYFLKQPETHSFRLYHDYTESRVGVDRYLNVVRAGSKASNPSATILDTGEILNVETLRGEQITERGIDMEVTPETEVVVIWFAPVKDGQSVRLRIEETYTDPNRYVTVGDELVWDRSFGRPRNTVILPDGWWLTANAVPAVVSETEDGRIALRYVNDRPGDIDVFVKARRRSIR